MRTRLKLRPARVIVLLAGLAVSTASSAEIPRITLSPAGQIVLRSPGSGPEPEVRDVRKFVIDARGRIAFIRGAGTKRPALLVIDQEGNAVRTIALEPELANLRPGRSNLTCAGPDRYLLLRNDPRGRELMTGVAVDLTTGQIAPIPGFTTSPYSQIAGFADGGFVVKGGAWRVPICGFAADTRLREFDHEAHELWSQEVRRRPGLGVWAFMTEGVIVTTAGLIAFDDLSRKIEFYDRTGMHPHTVHLNETRRGGWEPPYISADRDGGVVIHDRWVIPTIFRIGADGVVRARVKPRLKDGQTIVLEDAQVAPDGALWVSDGQALFRLTESGEVDRVLGAAPDPRRFDQAVEVTLDGNGRIYAVNRKTGAVQVFEADERWVRVWAPERGYLAVHGRYDHITVGDSGENYLRLLDDTHDLRRSAEGQWIGTGASTLKDGGEEWYAQPGTGRRWVFGDKRVYLMNADGTVVRTIDRRADGILLNDPEHASVAASGSIAIVSSIGDAITVRLHEENDGRVNAVSIYSPRGEPTHTFKLPSGIRWLFPRIAFDGQRVVVAGEKDIVCFRPSGKAIWRFTPPREDDRRWTPFLAPDGRHLLLFDGSNRIDRFELP